MLNWFTIRRHQTAMMVLIATVAICSTLITFFNSTQQDLFLVSSAYIVLSYLLFLFLVFIKVRQQRSPKFLHRVPFVKTALTFIMMSCLLMTLEQISQHRLLYNSGAILAYALLLFYIVSYVQQKMPQVNEVMSHKQWRFYLVYAIFLLVIFLISPTMDQSDPYGPHFQLRMVFWLLFLHMIVSWVVNLWKLNQQLRNERTYAELSLLKSQINPHFFFNTLNNLYGLALEKSDQTPELILRLSGMMRYIIYQGQHDWVSLQDEIDYLNNFIELQHVRFQKRVSVSFNTAIEQDIKVPPLLFINLIENAYKHGVEKLTDNAYVLINLTVKRQQLTFEIANNYDPTEQNNIIGIGLSNLRKRLMLLYPDKHQLTITDSQNRYHVILVLTLSESNISGALT